MKKILASMVLTTVFLLTFSGCDLFHKHEFSEWKTVKEVTCTEDGTQERVCECGEKETQTIPSTGHDWVEEGCANLDYCKNCGEHTGSKDGHKYSGDTCTVCNKTMYHNLFEMVFNMVSQKGTTDEDGKRCYKSKDDNGTYYCYSNAAGEDYVKIVWVGKVAGVQPRIEELKVMPHGMAIKTSVFTEDYSASSTFTASITSDGIGALYFDEDEIGIGDGEHQRELAYKQAKKNFGLLNGFTYTSTNLGTGFTFEEYLDACC